MFFVYVCMNVQNAFRWRTQMKWAFRKSIPNVVGEKRVLLITVSIGHSLYNEGRGTELMYTIPKSEFNLSFEIIRYAGVQSISPACKNFMAYLPLPDTAQ